MPSSRALLAPAGRRRKSLRRERGVRREAAWVGRPRGWGGCVGGAAAWVGRRRGWGGGVGGAAARGGSVSPHSVCKERCSHAVRCPHMRREEIESLIVACDCVVM